MRPSTQRMSVQKTVDLVLITPGFNIRYQTMINQSKQREREGEGKGRVDVTCTTPQGRILVSEEGVITQGRPV